MGTSTARLLSLSRFLNNNNNNNNNNLLSISTRLFSISSSSAALIHHHWSHSSDDDESPVYKRALRLQRPTTVKYQPNLLNSVSLIGEINLPLKEMNAPNGRYGVHTFLRVDPTRAHRRFLLMMLIFWDEMAEMSVQHLKLNDRVYVSGRLGSYMKADGDGKLIRRYCVDVTELNFIHQFKPDPVSQSSVESDASVPAKDIMQMRRDRHHLWHIFFSNPYEWWDNRKNKLNPNAPDFKHKDTGEVLWLQDSDPPWIRKQLQLHDSRLRDQSPRERYLSPLIYDDAKET